MPSATCAGWSEIENSTESVVVWGGYRFQGGTTNTSLGPHSSTWSSTLVVPPPSVQTKMVPSVDRYFSPLKPFGRSARWAPIVGSTGPPLIGLAYGKRAPWLLST